jgi:adenosylcobinamide-phosphate synthase
MSPAITLLLAVLFDRLFGELPRLHPLVGFGRLAARIEKNFYPEKNSELPVKAMRLQGILACASAILPFFAIASVLQAQPVLGKITELVVLYLALGSTSLKEHAESVASALADGNLSKARGEVSKIVSRDTTNLSEEQIVRATIESVLENGCDAVFAPIFWFLLLGAPGVVLYRLANTLDAMWGYKNERYLHFGWAAARLDDLLNWVPARLTAATYTLVGKTRSAWLCWRTQGPLWYSPNAGPVMASGAGALEVELGGPAIYHGSVKDRPVLGIGRQPAADDIAGAIRLVQFGLLAWVALCVLGSGIHA